MMIFFLIAILLWLIPIWVGSVVGKSRGRQGLGILLAILAGWIGVLIVAVLGPTEEAQRAQILSQGFECPFCREPVRQGAIVCPHCRRDLPV